MAQATSFTTDQARAVEAILSGKNVFLTGEGGTGKSFVLQHAIAALRQAGKRVAVCAPTGIAALNVGGCTLHRTFGLPVGVVPDPAQFRSDKASEMLGATDVVVIDEVGMARADMFDAVAACILRENAGRRRSRLATGVPGVGAGRPVQLVVVGDFYQLPPVLTASHREVLEAFRPELAGKGCFAFQGLLWDEFGFVPVVLREQKRQQNGSEHVRMLNLARVGDPSCLAFFNERAGIEPPHDTVYLCTTNRAVEEKNVAAMESLPGPEYALRAEVSGGLAFPGDEVPVEEVVRLKVGARVMTVANDVSGGKYVNGTLGTVVEVDERARAVVVRPDGGEPFVVYPHTWHILEPQVVVKDGKRLLREREVASFTQVPIRLAWAMTIHKSQGQTFEDALVDARPAHEDRVTPGLAYVALSRLKSVEGTYLVEPLEEGWLKAGEDVAAFHSSLEVCAEEA